MKSLMYQWSLLVDTYHHLRKRSLHSKTSLETLTMILTLLTKSWIVRKQLRLMGHREVHLLLRSNQENSVPVSHLILLVVWRVCRLSASSLIPMTSISVKQVSVTFIICLKSRETWAMRHWKLCGKARSTHPYVIIKELWRRLWLESKTITVY